MRVFRFFESLLEPTALPPGGPPPAGLGAFYWHYARQARHLVAALFVAGFVVAIVDATIPVFIGRVVTLVSGHEPGSLLHDNWPQLVGMALVLLIVRPAALLLQNLITNQGIIPGFSNLIRWQSHWHVVRQSWTFFQNDFAGRIANGRTTTRTRAMPSSGGHESRSSEPGSWLETSVITRPTNTGIVVSISATIKPATKSATTRPRAWRA